MFLLGRAEGGSGEGRVRGPVCVLRGVGAWGWVVACCSVGVGQEAPPSLSDRGPISRQTVRNILRGETWIDLPHPLPHRTKPQRHAMDQRPLAPARTAVAAVRRLHEPRTIPTANPPWMSC